MYKMIIVVKQTPANAKKHTGQVMASLMVKKLQISAALIAQARKVLKLIPLARMDVENSSQGKSHAPGPKPIPKKAV